MLGGEEQIVEAMRQKTITANKNEDLMNFISIIYE